MHHAAIHFAEEIAHRSAAGEVWDLAWCSDMLDLASFKGLSKPAADLPAVLYFHENQFAYPLAGGEPVDYTYGFINATSALAADAVWFNSAYNRDSFLEGWVDLVRRMKDARPTAATERLRHKSTLQPQGIHPVSCGVAVEGPLRILWAARWEHDKDPETFFSALRILAESETPFRLSVIGEQFAESPAIFAEARTEFDAHILHWGYQDSRAAYDAALREADVVVSTARQEFFGVSVVEAASAGAVPVLPRRLAYPEVWDEQEGPAVFFDGTAEDLASRLDALAERKSAGDLQQDQRDQVSRITEPFWWSHLAPRLDAALEQVRGRED